MQYPRPIVAVCVLLGVGFEQPGKGLFPARQFLRLSLDIAAHRRVLGLHFGQFVLEPLLLFDQFGDGFRTRNTLVLYLRLLRTRTQFFLGAEQGLRKRFDFLQPAPYQ